MLDQKQLWEKLARENSRYYIDSGKGRKITEEEFRENGKRDYEEHIASDGLLATELPNFNELFMVDYGCGTGRLAEFMAKDFYEVIGIDISGEMIKQAQERLKKVKNVEFIETNGYAIQLPCNSVDFVFSFLVFQHIKTREMLENTFKEIFRILRSKGIFKVRVRIDKIDSMDAWWAGVDCDEQMAINAGFKLLRKEKVGHYGLWLWLKKP
jgi:ubiquinone/menaquinone biosynthesis C-methylase UbiE